MASGMQAALAARGACVWGSHIVGVASAVRVADIAGVGARDERAAPGNVEIGVVLHARVDDLVGVGEVV